jgi:hypothetical protein
MANNIAFQPMGNTVAVLPPLQTRKVTWLSLLRLAHATNTLSLTQTRMTLCLLLTARQIR